MQYLKVSTAADVMLGVFVDDMNGKDTEETLTLAQADLQLSKNCGAATQKDEANSATHIYGGNYKVPLNATDTNTLGRLDLMCKESGALPVKANFTVITANVYDSMCSTDKFEVDINQIGGVAQSATDFKDLVDEGYNPVTHKVQGVVLTDTITTYSGNTKQTANNNTILSHADYGLAKLVRSTTPANSLDVNATGEAGLDFDNIKNASGAHTLANITIPVCTANSDMRGTNNANTVVPDEAGTAATLSGVAMALTDIHLDHLLAVDYNPASKPGVATALLNELVENDGGTSRYTANALENAPFDAVANAVWEASVTDYTVSGTTGKVLSNIEEDAAKIDIIDSIVDRILAATEIKQCVVTDAAATSLSFTTDLTETSNQFWKRAVILITSGANEGQMRAILNYDGSTKKITMKTPLSVAPAENDTFIILAERKYLTADIEDIIDTMYDEPTIDHTTSGTFGETFTDIEERTDNLPDFPAPAQEYDTTLSGIQEDLDNPDQYKANVSGLAPAQEYDTTLSGIQEDLDNPDQYKANVSGLAPAQEYDAEFTAIQNDVTFLKDIEGGKWELINNQMIFYKADNETVVATFKLLDVSGDPTMQNVYKRERV